MLHQMEDGYHDNKELARLVFNHSVSYVAMYYCGLPFLPTAAQGELLFLMIQYLVAICTFRGARSVHRASTVSV